MGKSRSKYYDDEGYYSRVRHNEKDVNKTKFNKHRKNLYKYSSNQNTDDDYDEYYDTTQNIQR
jgi:hypothetical protein